MKKSAKNVMDLVRKRERLVLQYDEMIMEMADDWSVEMEKKMCKKMRAIRKVCEEIKEIGEADGC